MTQIAEFVTDFADQAVILPLTVSLAVSLYLLGWRREAVIWCCVVCGTLGFMLILKLGFGACGHLILGGNVESPSGHTAAAGVTYGSILAFLIEQEPGRAVMSFIGVLFIVGLVGVSRLVLNAHTPIEVLIGACVGLGSARLMLRLTGQPNGQMPHAHILIVPLIIMFIMHGRHLHAETEIRPLADYTWPLSLCRP